MIYFGVYNSQGTPSAGIWALAQVSEHIFTTAFIGLFISLSSGWTIFRRKLSILNRIRSASFVSAYFMLGLASIIWSLFQSKESLYISYYTTAPGTFIYCVLMFVGIRYNILCKSIITKFNSDVRMLNYLRILGSVFIVCRPFFALITIGVSLMS